MFDEQYAEQFPVERLCGRDAYHAISLVDNKHGTPETSTINEHNLEIVIKSATDYLRQVRERIFEDAMVTKGWNDNLPKHVRDLRQMTSASHAIQCAVNSARDLDLLTRHLFKVAEEHGLASSDTDLQKTSGIIERARTAQQMITKLYEVDIARRFSELNKNPKIFESFLPKFETVKPELLEFLRVFRIRNSGFITEDTQAKIKVLEDTITTATPDKLKEILYDDIIRPLSRLIFFDWKICSELVEKDIQTLFLKQSYE